MLASAQTLTTSSQNQSNRLNMKHKTSDKSQEVRSVSEISMIASSTKRSEKSK